MNFYGNFVVGKTIFIESAEYVALQDFITFEIFCHFCHGDREPFGNNACFTQSIVYRKTNVYSAVEAKKIFCAKIAAYDICVAAFLKALRTYGKNENQLNVDDLLMAQPWTNHGQRRYKDSRKTKQKCGVTSTAPITMELFVYAGPFHLDIRTNLYYS